MKNKDIHLDEPIATGRTAEIFPWKEGQVLKLFRDWCPVDWVTSEARLGCAVHASGLNVPAVRKVVEVEGRHGIIYQRVDGPTMLQVFQKRPWRLVSSARLLAELHAGMHQKKVDGLPELEERLKSKIKSAKALPNDLRQAALDTLSRLPKGEQLCHGDFHPDNVVMTDNGPMIIDWPDAAQGHPLADVARTTLLICIGNPGGISPLARMALNTMRRWYHSIYTRRYFELSSEREQNLQTWLLPISAGRLSEEIPDERDKLLEYVRRLAI